MPTIAYFIDDHGYGHASRNIAIIRSLLECNLEISIIILTSKPLPFIKQSLHSSDNEDRIKFHEFYNIWSMVFIILKSPYIIQQKIINNCKFTSKNS